MVLFITTALKTSNPAEDRQMSLSWSSKEGTFVSTQDESINFIAQVFQYSLNVSFSNVLHAVYLFMHILYLYS
jgi:hypothetical protein